MDFDGQPAIRTIFLLLAGLIVLTGIAGAETFMLVPQDIGMKPGETVTVNLLLDDAPDGLSGYRAMVSIEPSGIAEITEVTFPAWAEFTAAEGAPGARVKITGVDLNGQRERGSKEVILATLMVRGIADGSSIIGFREVFFDSDSDERIIPAAVNGTILVSITPAVPAGVTASVTIAGTTNATGTTPGASSGSSSGSQGSSSGGSLSGSPGLTITAATTTGSPEIPGSAGQVTTIPATPQTRETAGNESPPMTTPITQQLPAPGSTGIPFLSIAGTAALVTTLVVLGFWYRKREGGD